MIKNIACFALILLFVFIECGMAEHDHGDHDVIIGLDSTVTPYQLTLANSQELEPFELQYNAGLGLYYGGQACWIPQDGPLHVMAEYGDGTPPAGIYQLDLAVVTMPSGLIAFDSESVSQILNGESYALDDWNWEEEEGWHFHNHISWGLDPSLITAGQTVTASFKLTDSTGQYADSDIFTLSFVAVPEPIGLAFLTFGAGMLYYKKNQKRR